MSAASVCGRRVRFGRIIFLREMFPEQHLACGAQRIRIRIVAGEQRLCFRGKVRAAAVFAAGVGNEQGEAEEGFAFFCNAPGFGIGHAHFGCGCAQGMQPVHVAQQRSNAGAKGFSVLRKNADGEDRVELSVFH